MLKIDYIQEYLVLAETLNFSKTAELTYITQPALSRHIAMIEEEMGAKLFDRTTRNVELTPAGEAVRDQFQVIVQSYQLAREQAELLSTGKSGVLVLNSPYYWTEDFVEPVVLEFEEEYPEVDMRIRSVQPVDGIDDMLEGEGDLAITMQKAEIAPNVRRVPFARERLAVALRDDHPFADRSSLKLEELRGEEFVAMELDTSDFGNYNTFLLDLLASRGIYPGHLRYTQQVDTMGLTIRKGGGVCIVPYGVRHMDRSYLRVIPLEDEDCFFTLCLYYLVEDTNPLIPTFVQVACEVGEMLG